MTIPLDKIKRRFREQYGRDVKAKPVTITKVWNGTKADNDDDRITLVVMKMKGMGK